MLATSSAVGFSRPERTSMGFGSAFAGEGAGGFSAGEGAGFDTGLERLEPEREEPELERFLGDGEITFLLGLTIVLPSFSTTSQPLGTVTFPVGVSYTGIKNHKKPAGSRGFKGA